MIEDHIHRTYRRHSRQTNTVTLSVGALVTILNAAYTYRSNQDVSQEIRTDLRLLQREVSQMRGNLDMLMVPSNRRTFLYTSPLEPFHVTNPQATSPRFVSFAPAP